jgi:hypothetical protein
MGDAPMAQDDHGTAAQAAESQSCPLCTGLAWLRETRPEAVEHLVKAGAELLLAARALLDGAAEPSGSPAPGRRRARQAAEDAAGNGLKRIDIG